MYMDLQRTVKHRAQLSVALTYDYTRDPDLFDIAQTQTNWMASFEPEEFVRLLYHAELTIVQLIVRIMLACRRKCFRVLLQFSIHTNTARRMKLSHSVKYALLMALIPISLFCLLHVSA